MKKPSGKKRAPRAPRFRWEPQAALGLSVVNGSRRLAVLLQLHPGEKVERVAVAIEGPAGGGAEAVFADHGHQIIGRFSGVGLAIAMAEKYTASWLRRAKSTRSEPCSCGEIPPTN